MHSRTLALRFEVDGSPCTVTAVVITTKANPTGTTTAPTTRGSTCMCEQMTDTNTIHLLANDSQEITPQSPKLTTHRMAPQLLVHR